MKKIIIAVVVLFSITTSVAQIQTNLIVNGNPPSTLTQWSINRETIIYIVGRPISGGGVDRYKIKTEIKTTDGTVVGKTDLTKSRIYTFGSTATITYSATDVLPLEHFIFSGSAKNTLDKTGKLPSNTYQICVQLVNPVDFGPISEERCRTFNLTAAQLPILLKPTDEEAINYSLAKTAIIFRWSPIVPTPKFIATYKLMVFEVLPHQNPVQAMRSNFPILTQEVKGTTQYIWQPQGAICCLGDQGDLDGDGNDERIKPDSTKKPTKEHIGHVTIIRGRTAKPIDTDSTNSNTQYENSILKTNTSNIENNVATKNKVEHSGDPHEYKKYVWTIQSFDSQGVAIGDGNINGDGVSEPKTFKVKHDTVKNSINNIR